MSALLDFGDKFICWGRIKNEPEKVVENEYEPTERQCKVKFKLSFVVERGGQPKFYTRTITCYGDAGEYAMELSQGDMVFTCGKISEVIGKEGMPFEVFSADIVMKQPKELPMPLSDKQRRRKKHRTNNDYIEEHFL